MPGTRSELAAARRARRQLSHARAIQPPQRTHRRHVDHHASKHWPALEEVTITWRGSYGYLTGYLSDSDDDTIKLCRIQYLGDPDDWAFAIWQASTGTYADAALLDGSFTGHPSQALDTACTLYLADTGDQPQ